MKRFIAVLIGLSVLLAFSAFAQAPAKGALAGHKAKTTYMTATGKVKELTATDLKIERVVKDKTEIMDFTLGKALTGIAAGDEVEVAYHMKDGKRMAMQVHKPVARKGSTAASTPSSVK